MGVIATGSIFKTLTFDGRSSSEFNVYITGEGVFNAPERAVEMISIPGRNGAFALDNGRFENIEVTYNCGIAGDSDTDFAEAVSAFRNWLCSRKGYVRLTDDYNADEYRMAVYKSGLEVTAERLIAGEFPIVFECKPQRFLTSGEDKITVGEWGETTTETGDIVEIENPDGILSVKSLTADINAEQDLNGYANPWVGGAGKNIMPPVTGGTTNGVTATVNSDGSVTLNGTASPSIALFRSGYFTLKAGQYVITGKPQADNNYAIYLDGVSGSASDGATLTIAEDIETRSVILVYREGTVSNVTCYPMVRLKSITDPTYEPYENICPITGWTDCEVTQTGFNQWDEEWEAGGISTANGGNATTAGYYRSKNYIPALPNTNYYWNVPTSMNVFFYDTDKNFINWTVGNNAVVTTPSGTAFIRFRNSTANAWTPYNNDISINYPATDTGYHAYNGATYSTALGQTVYGGTLDIVSGELTLTHSIATFIGDAGESWNMLSNPTRFSINYNPSFVLGTIVQGAELICNEYMFNGLISSSSDLNNGQFVWFTTNNLFVRDDTCANVADWKTKLQNVPLQIVGKLATPTTTTLTAQQVELLLGANNIWADTGNVTVEFGQNPNILVNPTLFESRPMLEVTGYGNVNLGSDTIEIHNELIGDVIVYNSTSWNNGSTKTIIIDTQYANNNDMLYVSNGPRFAADCLVEWSVPAGTITSSTITGSGDGDANITTLSNKTIRISADIFNSEFYFGTAATKTASGAISITTSNYGTLTGNISTTLAYDGDSTFTLSRSVTKPAQLTSANPYTSIGDITLTSSQPLLGNPIYIDLNIGEAYKIENDVPVSVNNGVVIPAELPTLAPGANMITCDDTITQLDIVPRWWKI